MVYVDSKSKKVTNRHFSSINNKLTLKMRTAEKSSNDKV